MPKKAYSKSLFLASFMVGIIHCHKVTLSLYIFRKSQKTRVPLTCLIFSKMIIMCLCCHLLRNKKNYIYKMANISGSNRQLFQTFNEHSILVATWTILE